MAGYYAMLQQQPSIYEMARGAAQVAQQRRAQEFAERQADADAKREENRMRFEQAKADRAAKAEQETAEAKSLANRETFWGRSIAEAQTPEEAQRRMAAAHAQGVDVGNKPVSAVLPDGRTVAAPFDPEGLNPSHVAMDLQGRGASVLGVQKPEDSPEAKMSAFARQLVDAGVPQGSEQFNAEMQRFNQAQLKRMERPPGAGGININLGGKPLPVEAVNYISDAQSAAGEVDNLMTAWRQIAPKTEAEALWARAQAKVPGTPQWQYVKEAEAVAQMYGLVREGGKLQASDFPRYLDQMPMPWDIEGSASRKHGVAKRLLSGQSGARREQLGGAGYRVPAAPAETDLDAYFDANYGGP